MYIHHLVIELDFRYRLHHNKVFDHKHHTIEEMVICISAEALIALNTKGKKNKDLFSDMYDVDSQDWTTIQIL